MVPRRRLTRDLAPAEMRKIGSAFDLPIAACVLAGMEALPPTALERYMVVGELSLEGRVRPRGAEEHRPRRRSDGRAGGN